MSKEVYIKVFNNILLADNLYNKDIYYLIDFVYYFPVDEDNENIIRLLKYILTYDDGSNAQKSSNRLFCSVYDYFEVLLDFDFNKLFLKFLP
ncbi:MAG: hypothetical protein LBU14_00940 [Candidatus Peribacteria bacterium]|jgi:hypothetical protein|nr:hypothetical protein [Candidatus Peribacteria bacterium]